MDELAAARRFYARHGQNYWRTLIEREREGSKKVYRKNGKRTLARSLYMSRDARGYPLLFSPDVFSIHDLSEEHIEGLVAGLEKVFRFYREAGVFSFNASLSLGPADQGYFSSCFRIVPRTFLNMRDFAPDLNFFQAILSEPICVVLPEDLCKDVKPYFE